MWWLRATTKPLRKECLPSSEHLGKSTSQGNYRLLEVRGIEGISWEVLHPAPNGKEFGNSVFSQNPRSSRH